MSELALIWQFIRAVFWNWIFGTGAMIASLLWLFEHIFNKEIPRKISRGTIIAALSISCFIVWRDAKTEVPNTQDIPPIKLDVRDESARNDLNEAKKEIAFLRSKIKRLENDNPLNRPIVLANATAVVEFETEKATKNGFSLSSGPTGMIALAKGNTPLLFVTTEEIRTLHAQAGRGKYQIKGASPSDNLYMGKPVSSLLDSEYIQVEFHKSFIPIGSKILGGDITWIINENIILKFTIPEQYSSKSATGNSAFYLRRLTDGLSPLITATPSIPNSAMPLH